MEQLEFDWGMKYDIFTDQTRPASDRDWNVYRSVYTAYGKVRSALNHFHGYARLMEELDQIHSQLQREIRPQ